MDNVMSMIKKIGPWFHNLHLPNGEQTAPDHPLGDFPTFKWRKIEPYIPADLTGWNVLDIGCNAGYYSFELAKRGASVVGIDMDEHYLNQARWASKQYGLEDKVEFKLMQVYDIAHQELTYDLIWFMGVFYHLRYPLLALDILSIKVKKMMVFQTMTLPGEMHYENRTDIELFEREFLQQPGWPKMAFIENRLAGDPTNWWAPNHGGVMAMLRSSGLSITEQPAHEVYICIPNREYLSMEDLREMEYKAAVGLK